MLRLPDDEAEGSRGLRLVEELPARWGYERGGGQATTWFEYSGTDEPPPRLPPGKPTRR